MRAHKLLLFQAQPFFVAEPFTARPAEHVPLAESIETFGAIVAGAHDQTPTDALQFVGAMRR
jgi:F-type H+-transporting ATPase subunit beta